MIEQLVRAYSDVPHILRMGLGHIPGALPPSIASGTTYFPGAGGPAPAAPVAQVAPPPPAAPVASAAAPSFGAPAFAPVPAGTPDQDGDHALSPAPGAFVQAPVAQPPAQPAAPGVSFGASAVPAPAAPQPQVPPAPGQAPLPPDVAAALEILKRNMGAIPGMPQQ